ncbi:MAG: glycosyltransferase [Syntrophobacterales bacterium]|nr:glycosyltransferase [Syntrophobacterales bacterium]
MRTIEDYRKIVGDEVISEIYNKAKKLYGKNILHVNSTYIGGGVAEILNSLLPLLNDAGLDADWKVLHGNADFFTITKKFHNAMQGASINLSNMKKQLYLQTNENFSVYTHINHDCVIVHDPQPLPLIKYYKKRQPWIWRCHVDLSNINSEMYDFIKGYILKYDLAIISNEKYRMKNLPVEQKIVYPAIDPLSPKNMELSKRDIAKYLNKFGIKTDKPLLAQISRFDVWKDPEGVLDAFMLVKNEIECRLVLCGGMAMDDPESQAIYERVFKKAEKMIATGDVILITLENNILVNALQRSASVIIQKSIREGFALTVSEALWKGTPVVASNVGGIPTQIIDGVNGFLVEPSDTAKFANRIIEILKNPDTAKNMGEKGRETVRTKFLTTRCLIDHLDILNEIMA